MNKTELIDLVAESENMTKKSVGIVINSAIQKIMNALADGEKVIIIGFGSIEVAERSARICRNPKTGDKVEVPATKVPRFSAGKELKELVGAIEE